MRRGFINAHFYGNSFPAVLVDEGRFIRFGSNEEIEKITGFDEVVDLQGMYVYPGFVDSHMHLSELGMYLNQVQLKGCTSLDQAASRIKKCEDEWIIGRGWTEEEIGAVPDKKFLDSLTSHPVALTRADGHMMAVNTAALKAAGISNDLDEADGRIDFAHGLVYENAMNKIRKAVPAPDAALIRKYIMDGAHLAASYGVTTVGSDDFATFGEDWRPVLDAFEKLSYQEELPVRVNEQCEFSSPQEFASFLDDGYTFEVGNDYFRIGPLKLITDGSLGAHTAYLTRPYLNDGSNQGMMIMDETTIETFVQLAHRFNMPVIAHAIGDGAVDVMLDIFKENTFDYYHGNPLHDGLVHCQILRKDQIERIIEYQLSCYFQSQFIEQDALLIQDVDPELRKDSYAWKTLSEKTLASNGSDAPVEMPDVCRGILYAITRKSSSGRPLNPAEALTREQAFASYTEKGYKQLFMNDRVGTLKEGYLADFTVIDRDILTCDINEIDQAKIMMTIMNGKTVYEK